MKNGIFVTVMVSAGFALGACAPKDDGATGDGIADTNNDDNAEGGSTGGADDTPDDSADDPTGNNTSPMTSGGESDESDSGPPMDGIGFIEDPDGGGVSFECDLFAQDCPEGEKCMPWANDGGSSWNATRCSPVGENPGQAGDECTVEGSGVSGIDSCDLGIMCWDVDPETNLGTCAAMCTGDEANPLCEDPDTFCVQANNGAIVLCLPSCDPLLQDCQEGQACYGINDGFACAPDASGDTGIFGDPCEFINACDPGLGCFGAAAFSSCAATGCCSSFCDITDPGATAACAAQDGGMECVAYYTEGDAPPGAEDIGVCAIPA